MKTLHSILFLVAFYSFSFSGSVTLKITYKGKPACYHNIEFKSGNKVLGSGRTNRDGVVETFLGGFVTTVDVYGTKNNVSWNAKGMTTFKNGKAYLKLEAVEELLKKGTEGMSDEMGAGVEGLFAGAMSAAIPNFMELVADCDTRQNIKNSSNVNNGFHSSKGTGDSKSSFKMTTSSSKSVNGKVVESNHSETTYDSDNGLQSNSVSSSTESSGYNNTPAGFNTTASNMSNTMNSVNSAANTAQELGSTFKMAKGLFKKKGKNSKANELDEKSSFSNIEKLNQEKIDLYTKLGELDEEAVKNKDLLKTDIKLVELRIQKEKIISKSKHNPDIDATDQIIELNSREKELLDKRKSQQLDAELEDGANVSLKITKLKYKLGKKKLKLKTTFKAKNKKKLKKEIEELELVLEKLRTHKLESDGL